MFVLNDKFLKNILVIVLKTSYYTHAITIIFIIFITNNLSSRVLSESY